MKLPYVLLSLHQPMTDGTLSYEVSSESKASLPFDRHLTGLQDLPSELLEQIQQEIRELSSHIAYRQLCRDTFELYDEQYLKEVCWRAGFTRPLLFKHRTWTELACTLGCSTPLDQRVD